MATALPVPFSRTTHTSILIEHPKHYNNIVRPQEGNGQPCGTQELLLRLHIRQDSTSKKAENLTSKCAIVFFSLFFLSFFFFAHYLYLLTKYISRYWFFFCYTYLKCYHRLRACCPLTLKDYLHENTKKPNKLAQYHHMTSHQGKGLQSKETSVRSRSGLEQEVGTGHACPRSLIPGFLGDIIELQNPSIRS